MVLDYWLQALIRMALIFSKLVHQAIIMSMKPIQLVQDLNQQEPIYKIISNHSRKVLYMNLFYTITNVHQHVHNNIILTLMIPTNRGTMTYGTRECCVRACVRARS